MPLPMAILQFPILTSIGPLLFEEITVILEPGIMPSSWNFLHGLAIFTTVYVPGLLLKRLSI